MPLTTDQILKLSPDAASAKAGQQLADSGKWVVTASGDNVIWGDCQGSGKKPYRTMIDLTNIAFKCSCPSRKFPCKHGLGLFLFFAQQPDAFTQQILPEDVSAWLSKRHTKEENKEQKKKEPANQEAKQKRTASRKKKISAGIDELRYWLSDVVRGGVMNVPKDLYNFNKNITARMVDTQAGGLAMQLRQIHKIDFFKEGWQLQLLKRLAKIYLLTEAYLHKEQLPENLRNEIEALIGWTTAKSDLLHNDGVRDAWTVMSLSYLEEDNLRTETIWLYGRQNKQFALLLHFYGGRQVPEHSLAGGMTIDAELVYFPGAFPLRAIIKEQHGSSIETMNALVGIDNSQAICKLITDTLSQNPFTEAIPLMADNVLLTYDDTGWWLKDHANNAVSIANAEEQCWKILAFSQGCPFSVFGLYENGHFELHTLWQQEKNYFTK